MGRKSNFKKGYKRGWSWSNNKTGRGVDIDPQDAIDKKTVTGTGTTRADEIRNETGYKPDWPYDMTGGRTKSHNKTAAAADESTTHDPDVQNDMTGRSAVTGTSDVKNTDPDVLRWAAEKGLIREGNSAALLAEDCTREQAVTFIWRMSGKPEPRTMESDFEDVSDNRRYSYKAVMWGKEMGIAKGKNGKFKPGGICNGEQILIMLWRMAGRPSPQDPESGTGDMTGTGRYSYGAVIWADENGISTGAGDGFHPAERCSIGDVLSFLYRYDHL